MICLKSPYMQTLVLSGLRMGAAHSAVSTDSKVPSVTKQFSSISILSHTKYATVRTLQYLGGVAGSTIVLTLKPLRVKYIRLFL